MADIEKRLDAIEKRLRADIEGWQKMEAKIKGLRLVVEAIAVPVLAAREALMNTVIVNLRTFEENSRLLNEHEDTVRQVTGMREFLEARRAERATRSGQPPPRE